MVRKLHCSSRFWERERNTLTLGLDASRSTAIAETFGGGKVLSGRCLLVVDKSVEVNTDSLRVRVRKVLIRALLESALTSTLTLGAFCPASVFGGWLTISPTRRVNVSTINSTGFCSEFANIRFYIHMLGPLLMGRPMLVVRSFLQDRGHFPGSF